MDELAVERLDMILDHVDDDHERLRGGEHVSGPAAAEYRIRLAQAAPFAGRAVTSVRNTSRLLASMDPNIHHGQGMTCVYRTEQAECRKTRLALGLTADGPDDAQCRSTCQNLAYPDRGHRPPPGPAGRPRSGGCRPAGASSAPRPRNRAGGSHPCRHRPARRHPTTQLR
jgi:hypothetical protein